MGDRAGFRLPGVADRPRHNRLRLRVRASEQAARTRERRLSFGSVGFHSGVHASISRHGGRQRGYQTDGPGGWGATAERSGGPFGALGSVNTVQFRRPALNRSGKADKIQRILTRRIAFESCDLLDIGAGDGRNAARLQALGARVTAVDRENRLARDVNLDFRLVDGTALPFDDGAFDAVVYTHVIEHVGERYEQLQHLVEIRRVLRKTGILYLSTPNRWAFVEPHYKLPLLSWCPESFASRYVRLAERGDRFDCRPLSRPVLRRLFGETGFRCEEVTGEVLDAALRERIGRPWLRKFALFAARRRWLSMPAIPVLAFVARPGER